MNQFRLAAVSLIVAAALWTIVFLIRPLGFWPTLSLSTLILLSLAVIINRDRPSWRLSPKLALIGIVSGIMLYALFFVGFQATRNSSLFSQGISQIYELKTIPTVSIGLLLLFPIGPGEEIYWRGLIQRRFSEKFGRAAGLLGAASAYALVHLPTMNLPLILTALIGGLVWGYIYEQTRTLWPTIISHVLFDLLIFVIAPFT